MKKLIGKIFLTAACLTGISLSADLPEPYASVENLPQTPYYVQDGYTYYDLIHTNSLVVIVDVESPDGAAGRFIAQQSNNLPSVQKVYSVNAFRSADPSQKHLFQRFLSNVIQEGTAAMIVPIRMTSQEGAESLNVSADFICVTGGNDQAGIYRDIKAWIPHLSNIGILCGNNWNDPSVQVGVTKAALELDLNLHVSNNVWYFKKSG